MQNSGYRFQLLLKGRIPDNLLLLCSSHGYVRIDRFDSYELLSVSPNACFPIQNLEMETFGPWAVWNDYGQAEFFFKKGDEQLFQLVNAIKVPIEMDWKNDYFIIVRIHPSHYKKGVFDEILRDRYPDSFIGSYEGTPSHFPPGNWTISDTMVRKGSKECFPNFIKLSTGRTALFMGKQLKEPPPIDQTIVMMKATCPSCSPLRNNERVPVTYAWLGKFHCAVTLEDGKRCNKLCQ